MIPDLNPQLTPEKLRVIMVEDDMDLCRGWSDVFDILDYEVKFFQNAKNLLEQPQTIQFFDLLITDYYLPDLNGLELTQKVREIHPELPVILLTGSREAGVTEGIKKIPNSLLLFKPLGIDELEKGIQKILNL